MTKLMALHGAYSPGKGAAFAAALHLQRFAGSVPVLHPDSDGPTWRDEQGVVDRLVGLVGGDAPHHLAEGEDDVRLIGHSNGGFLAVRLMLQRPDIFTRAVILSAGVLGRHFKYDNRADESNPAILPGPLWFLNGGSDFMVWPHGGVLSVDGGPLEAYVSGRHWLSMYDTASNQRREDIIQQGSKFAGMESTTWDYGASRYTLIDRAGHVEGLGEGACKMLVEWVLQ